MNKPRNTRFGVRLGWLALPTLALAGAWVCGTLVVEHDGGWQTARAGGTSYLLRLCETEALPSASCADVVGSRWGSFDLYIGARRVLIPTSLVGLAYFLSLAIWFAMVAPIRRGHRWLWRITSAVMITGGLSSVLLIAVMAFSLTSWCPACVIAHAINLILCVITVTLWSRQRDELAGGSASVATSAAIASPEATRCSFRGRLAFSALIVAVCASVGSWFYFDAMTEVHRQWRKLADARQVIERMQEDRAFVLREYYASPKVTLPAGHGEEHLPTVSSPSVTPRLVIFINYTCPGCACFASGRRSLIDAPFDGRLLVEHRHLPMVPVESDFTSQSDMATASARASEAARLQGGTEAFTDMHRLLFANRDRLPRVDYAQLAERIGLDGEQLLGNMKSETVRGIVAADFALAAELGVTSGPVLFLNDRRVPDLCVKSEVFWGAVGEETVATRHLASPTAP